MNKYVHDVICFLYYEYWTNKWKYIPYISVTHKVLKFCRSKTATLAPDVCDVHGASSLYTNTCWQKFFYICICIYIYVYAYIYLYIYIYTGFSLLGEWTKVCPFPKNLFIAPSLPNFYSFTTKSQFNPIKNKNVIFSCSYCSCTIFVSISYSFETQIMLVLILIYVQYSQIAVFSFEKFSNCQNHSSSGSHHLVKKSLQQCSLPFHANSGKLLTF